MRRRRSANVRRMPRGAPEADYPAAHSMDTTWFAVDQDGHIAVFDSSEDGAVPNAAATGGGAAEPSFDTFFLQAMRTVRVIAAQAADPAPDQRAARRFEGKARVLVVLAEREAVDERATYRGAERRRPRVEAMLAEYEPVVLSEVKPRCVATAKAIDPKRLAKLAAHHEVAELYTEQDLGDVIDGAGGDDGLYAFAHHWDEDYTPGRYARQAQPAAPLALDALPAAVREHVGAFRLPLRFGDAEKIELADYLRDDEAQTWGEVTLRGDPLSPNAAPHVSPNTSGASVATPKRDWTAFWFLAVVLVVLAVLASRK